MNKIYKLVWSKVKHCWVVASELAKSHSKSGRGSLVGVVNGTRVVLSAAMLVSSMAAPWLVKPAMAAQHVGNYPIANSGYLIDNWESSNADLYMTALRTAGYSISDVTGSSGGTFSTGQIDGETIYHYQKGAYEGSFRVKNGELVGVTGSIFSSNRQLVVVIEPYQVYMDENGNSSLF